jgi:YVTN family beta-propeller protein
MIRCLIFALLCGTSLLGETAQIPVDTFPMAGLVSPDGKYMLVMNAGVHPPGISVIDIASAKELSRTPVPDAWLGMTMTKSGDRIYVGGGSRAAVFEFSFANGVLKAGRTFPIVAEKDRTAQDFAGDVQFGPDGHLLYVANVFRDMVVVVNPQSGLILSKIKTGRRPYRILFHPSGKTMYVSSWADGAVGQYDVNSGERVANIRVAAHPTDLLWVDGTVPRVFVTASNTNSVYVMTAGEIGDLTKSETINLALTPMQPLGTTPSALALSADRKRVYVACSDINSVAVVDISGEQTFVAGFIHAGAYPTAVFGLAGGKIGILNGHANSVQLMDSPDNDQLAGSQAALLASLSYQDEKLAAPVGANPIKHVIYVVRGDDAEGVNRATAGIAPDFTVKLAPNTAGGRRRVYDFEGQEPANLPPAGFLWNAASQAGLKIRNYGFEVHNLAKANADGEEIDRVYDPALKDSTDTEYRGMDPTYPDAGRAKEFANEMKEYEGVGTLPDLLLVRIGKDDAALGTIKDAVAKSKFMNDSAVFVQDSEHPSMSVLRTVETILGLRPMTIFDAAANPAASVPTR